jgi:hypothetical protein
VPERVAAIIVTTLAVCSAVFVALAHRRRGGVRREASGMIAATCHDIVADGATAPGVGSVIAVLARAALVVLLVAPGAHDALRRVTGSD